MINDMRIGMKKAAILCSLVLVGFSPMERPPEAVNYYSLRNLAGADMPRRMRVIKLADGARGRASVEDGMLVTFKSREAARVDVAGTFSNWRPVRMERGARGVWYHLITTPSRKKEIHYKFVVDGIWTSDPKNPYREYDGNGSYLSVIEPFSVPEGRQVSFRMIGKNTVEFRTWNPGARMISLVGDFNHWNPENDLLRRGNDGVWRLRKRLSKGDYRYKFIVDGRWQPDYFNGSSASDEVGGICSVVRVN